MIKINVLKGHWQLACAREIMVSAWKLVKEKKVALSVGLKRSWKEVKDFIKKISNSYAEYKYKLKIHNQTIMLSFKNDDLDEVVEQALEKIAEVKGKKFIYNISDRIYSKYDFLLDKLKRKGTLTFAQDVFIIKSN